MGLWEGEGMVSIDKSITKKWKIYQNRDVGIMGGVSEFNNIW